MTQQEYKQISEALSKMTESIIGSLDRFIVSIEKNSKENVEQLKKSNKK